MAQVLHIPPRSCFPGRGTRQSTYSEDSAASSYGRAGVGRRTAERRRGLIGAWCGAGTRRDLRHRPRHRCAVATPVPPARDGCRGGIVVLCPRQTSRRRTSRPPEADGESTTATAHLSFNACRGSVATSFPTRLTEAPWSWRPGGCRDAGRRTTSATQRPVAPVLGRRDAGAGEHAALERPRRTFDRSLVDRHHLQARDLSDRAY